MLEAGGQTRVARVGAGAARLCHRYVGLLARELERPATRTTLMPGVEPLLDRLEDAPGRRARPAHRQPGRGRRAQAALRRDRSRRASASAPTDRTPPTGPTLPEIAARRAEPLVRPGAARARKSSSSATRPPTSTAARASPRARSASRPAPTRVTDLAACGPHAVFEDLSDTERVLEAILAVTRPSRARAQGRRARSRRTSAIGCSRRRRGAAVHGPDDRPPLRSRRPSWPLRDEVLRVRTFRHPERPHRTAILAWKGPTLRSPDGYKLREEIELPSADGRRSRAAPRRAGLPAGSRHRARGRGLSPGRRDRSAGELPPHGRAARGGRRAGGHRAGDRRERYPAERVHRRVADRVRAAIRGCAAADGRRSLAASPRAGAEGTDDGARPACRRRPGKCPSSVLRSAGSAIRRRTRGGAARRAAGRHPAQAGDRRLRAGRARAAPSPPRATRTAPMASLNRVAWLALWEKAVAASAERVTATVNARLEEAAAESRYPARRLRAALPHARRHPRDRRAARRRWRRLRRGARRAGAGGPRGVGAIATGRAAAAAGASALTAAARRLEAAWLALEQAAAAEQLPLAGGRRAGARAGASRAGRSG